jgi:RecA-family ATPase
MDEVDEARGCEMNAIDLSMQEFYSIHQVSHEAPRPRGLDLSTKRVDLANAFAVTPPALDFIMPGFLSGTVGALVATSGLGKSFWAVESAMAIASGSIGDPLSLKPGGGGRVVFCSLEDPLAILKSRIHSIGKVISAPARDAISQNLDILDLYGERIDLMNSTTVNSIVDYASGARLIVVDTLSRAHQLDENKNGEMAQLMSQMDNITKLTGASLLFIHHISKSSGKEGRGNEASASRGASVLVDNSRFVCFLQSMTKEQAKESNVSDSDHWQYIKHGVSKVNYCMKPHETWLEKGGGGVLAFSRINTVDRGFEVDPNVVCMTEAGIQEPMEKGDKYDDPSNW